MNGIHPNPYQVPHVVNLMQLQIAAANGAPVYGLNELQFIGSILTELHFKVSWSELPDIYGPPNSETRKQLLTAVSHEDIATGVEECVQEYLRATGLWIYRFRVSMLYPLGQDDRAWPVLEWTDNQGGEVVAIFETDVQPGPDVCSWIMHRGVGRNNGQIGGRIWHHSELNWSVTGIDILGTLVKAAQHLSAMLDWSHVDIQTIYCFNDFQNASPEE
jgi:hypothetical protein